MKIRAERTDPKIRKLLILQSAVILAGKIGHMNITRDAVAKEAKIGSSTVARYYRNMKSLKTKVLSMAISQEIMPVLAHALVLRVRLAPTLKCKIVDYLASL